MTNLRFITALLPLLLLLISACSSSSRKQNDSGRPVVTVSIEPQRWLVDRLADGRVEVRTLMGKNADPESFDPTVSALRDVERSEAYLMLGNNAAEQAVVSRLRSTGADILFVDTSEGIDLIRGTHCTHPGEHHGHSHDADAPDPHTWQSVRNMRIMAANTAAALKRIDPEGDSIYSARLTALNHELDWLDADLTLHLGEQKAHSFLVWHPSFSYFARDYGLTQIALGSEGKEITPAAMARTIDEARRSGAKIMLLQPDDDPSRSADIARQAGARAVTVNTLHYDWPATMRALATAIHP